MKHPFALGVALVLSVVSAGVMNAAPPAAGPAIDGTWSVEVSVDPAIPVGDFTALETYSDGGGLVTTNNISRAVGVDVGQGAWARLDGHTYRTSILFFVFNADGARAGAIEVQQTIRLTSRDAYLGEGQATLRAANGDVIATAPFTSVGRRMPATAF
jgi:hypothetical protein